MFGFIIGIICLVAAIVLPAVIRHMEYSGGWLAGVIAMVLAVVFIVSSCVSTVPTGHTGILTTFGRVEDTNLPEGLNFHAPWQAITTMSNKEQRAGGNGLAFSKDMQEVSYAYTVRHQLISIYAPTVYKSVGTDYYNIVIDPIVNSVIKEQTGKANAEGLITSREGVTAFVNEEVAALCSAYGLTVTVIIDNFDFTDAFTNAVEAKQVATQEKLRAQTEQERLTMEAQQKAERDRIAAESAAEIARINATADLEVQKISADAAEYAGQKEAAVNKAVAESITDELIAYQYALRWDGKLPQYMFSGSDSALPIVNIPMGVEE
jgi:regulator of protease activity HflC (stomatin/prohibitin superfamily)